MNVGVLWRNQKGNGPVATGYLKILGVDVPIAVWKNQKRTDKDPDLTISLRTPKPVSEQVPQKEFEDDPPF